MAEECFMLKRNPPYPLPREYSGCTTLEKGELFILHRTRNPDKKLQIRIFLNFIISSPEGAKCYNTGHYPVLIPLCLSGKLLRAFLFEQNLFQVIFLKKQYEKSFYHNSCFNFLILMHR